MKKLAIALLSLFLLFGCQKSDIITSEPTAAAQPQSLFEKLGGTDGIALICNNKPDIEVSEQLNLDDFGDKIYIIPKNICTSISIFTAKYEDELERDKLIFKIESTPLNYSLLVEAYRPEGIPNYIIVFNYGETEKEYIIYYDGKDGTPDIEEIK